MDGERIRELAEQAAKETAIEFTDRARAQPDAIERAIRAALVEAFREPPSDAMLQKAIERHMSEGDWKLREKIHFFRAVYNTQAEIRRREFEGQG